MLRKLGSTMTAVEIVSARFDGPIPAEVMMQARAEDDAYRSNPRRVMAEATIANIGWNTDCARQSIARIRKLIAAGQDRAANTERLQILCAHIKARRQYQAELRQIMQGAA